MDITAFSQLFTGVFGDYWGVVIVTMLCTVCAVIAAFTPAPDEKSGVLYKVFYKVVNILAANVGKATNADEVKHDEKKDK